MKRSESGDANAKKPAGSLLESLKAMTSVVADTGDFEKIKLYRPEDATTNPSLLFAAVKMVEYKAVVDAAISEAKATGAVGDDLVEEVMDQLNVAFGCKILDVVPGYVSTEVDARLSFDTEKSIAKARKLIKMYEKKGISKSRVLIKLGTTWESVKACEVLQKEGILCNMTLLFSFAQAVACAEAGATLISPFVGRILDWFKKSTGKASYTADEDPGVLSVRRIYAYYKKYGYKTIVMGASFRNKDEIFGLAGCDKLTIAPALLEELQNASGEVTRVLTPEMPCDEKKISLGEKEFRWMMNEDAMATEKLAEGIRNFNKDSDKLREIVREKLK
jgi:transaldolase